MKSTKGGWNVSLELLGKLVAILGQRERKALLIGQSKLYANKLIDLEKELS